MQYTCWWEGFKEDGCTSIHAVSAPCAARIFAEGEDEFDDPPEGSRVACVESPQGFYRVEVTAILMVSYHVETLRDDDPKKEDQ